jgi:hypothetical protein
MSGKKTEDQILQEFLETFETAHAMRNNDTPNYVVTKEEFEEYYNNISASIDDDNYFKLMMENAWKLTEESRKGMGTKGWAMDDGGSKGGAGAGSRGARRGQDTGSNLFGHSTAPKKQATEAGVAQNATE